MYKNNQVTVSGKIRNAFTYAGEKNEKPVCTAELDIIRKHHRYPHTVTVMVPSEMVGANEDYAGQMVIVTGGLRSYDTSGEAGQGLGIYIMAETITITTAQERQVNEVCLRGVLCRRPLTKIVSHDNLVTMFFLAVDYQGQTAYVPCSVGDLQAMDVAAMDVGTELEISGRIHSRYSRLSVWIYQDKTSLRRI